MILVNRRKTMKKKLFPSATWLLIVGVAFFTLGLLAILKLSPVFNWFSQISPNLQAAEALGVAVQFLGQALVILGVIKFTINNLVSSMQVDRKIAIEGFSQSIRQLQTGYLQTLAKLDTIIANQKIAPAGIKQLTQLNCKYCGAQIGQGRFCPQCGKAN
jgi:hypothetical protein